MEIIAVTYRISFTGAWDDDMDNARVVSSVKRVSRLFSQAVWCAWGAIKGRTENQIAMR